MRPPRKLGVLQGLPGVGVGFQEHGESRVRCHVLPIDDGHVETHNAACAQRDCALDRKVRNHAAVDVPALVHHDWWYDSRQGRRGTQARETLPARPPSQLAGEKIGRPDMHRYLALVEMDGGEALDEGFQPLCRLQCVLAGNEFHQLREHP